MNTPKFAGGLSRNYIPKLHAKSVHLASEKRQVPNWNSLCLKITFYRVEDEGAGIEDAQNRKQEKCRRFHQFFGRTNHDEGSHVSLKDQERYK